jgi:hypothetical protein
MGSHENGMYDKMGMEMGIQYNDGNEGHENGKMIPITYFVLDIQYSGLA